MIGLANDIFVRPVFIFFGGLLQLFGGIGEWILGNTFSSVLFFTYGKYTYQHMSASKQTWTRGCHSENTISTLTFTFPS